MNTFAIGVLVGALLIGSLGASYQRTVRARSDWVGLRKAHHGARRTFWRELGGLVGAALAPILGVVALLTVLYWIGRSR